MGVLSHTKCMKTFLRYASSWINRLKQAFLGGRIPIEPITIPDQHAFIEYLERNTIRRYESFFWGYPISVQGEDGCVFLAKDGRVLIRHNPKRYFLGLGISSCVFSGKIENDGTKDVLRGAYRLQGYEFFRYFVLAWAVFVPFYFLGYLVFVGSSTLIIDAFIVALQALVFYGIAMCIGNVSWSPLARKDMKKIDELLAGFRRYSS